MLFLEVSLIINFDKYLEKLMEMCNKIVKILAGLKRSVKLVSINYAVLKIRY
jgi:hypothetical protein